MSEVIEIENEYYVLQIGAQTGVIARIFDKPGQIELIAQPRLAENFRLLLPLPDLEANYILGAEQQLSKAEKMSDGLLIHWVGPLRNPQGGFDLDVTMRIAFVGQGIEFQLTVQNRTPYKLAEVWHAGLGGLLGVGDRQKTRTILPKPRGPDTEWLFRHFPESMGVGGGGGMRFPEYYVHYPVDIGMPWLDMANTDLKRGVYYACLDPVPRFNTLRFEMHPGLARNRLSGNWPTDEEIAPLIDQYPPGLVMHWVNFPYTKPGETFTTPPVLLQCHDGDWHQAARLYRAWFTEHFPIRQAEQSWLRQAQAIQDTMFMLPEGNIMLSFQEIPQWAQDARDFGVNAVLISGWNVGGHDNQYPNYTPDPRLGTWEELAAGIEACHSLGVKVFFFANIQPVDISTEWYRDELYQYRMMNGKGQITYSGWGMGTLGARMGLTRPPISGCDPGFAVYRHILVEQMRKLAEIGADGIHYDKVIGHNAVNFNPALTVPGDQSYFRGVIACMEETLAAGQTYNPEFCLGVESPWDRLLSYCDAWWLWHDMLDHLPVMKYTFPEFLPTFAVVQPWDYNNVNNAIRYGYQLIVGPVRYSCSIADQQSRPIATYIAEALRIRAELQETIFFSEFLDTLEVSVVGSEPLKFNSHRNRKTGKRACVVVNQSEAPLEATVRFDGNAHGPVLLYQPFVPVTQTTLPVTVAVPGERFVIVVEQ